MKKISLFGICLVFLIVLALPLPGLADDVKTTIEKPVKQAIDTRQATQQAEEKWRLDREKLVQRFEALETQHARLVKEIADLNKDVDATKIRIQQKKQQLTDIAQISKDIEPFLNDIIKSLKARISDGLPFLVAERTQRVEKLEALMPDPDITVSEKYRKVMEALVVEAEYGFTLELTQETIFVNKEAIFADIFRLGRLNLFFLSPDRTVCGFFNISEKKWEPLPSSHLHSLEIAADIAAKRHTAELLDIPIGRIVVQ